MLDRLQHALVRSSIVVLITLCFIASVTFLTSAMFATLAGRSEQATGAFALSFGAGFAVYLMCRHRNDLMYC